MSDQPDVNRDGHGGEERTPLWVKLFGGVFVIIILVVLVLHLMGRGMGGHG